MMNSGALPLIDPRTGKVIETYPDDVDPAALPGGPISPEMADAAHAAATASIPTGSAPPPLPLEPITTANFGARAANPWAPGVTATETAPVMPTPPPSGPAVEGVPPLLARPEGPPPMVPEGLRPPPPPPPKMPAPAPSKGGGGGGAPRVATGSATPAVPGALKVAFDAQQSALTAEGAAKQAETDVAIKKANDEAERVRLKSEALNEANASAEKQRGEALGYLKQSRDAIKNYKMTDLFEGRAGSKIASALMIGLGQYAATMTGTKNTALEIINDQMNRWETKQRAEYQKLIDTGQMAERDLQLVDAEIANKKAGILEKFAGMRDELEARYGGKEAQAKGGVMQATLLKESAALKLQAEDIVHKRSIDERDYRLREIATKASAAAAYANAAESRARASAAKAAATGGVGGVVSPDQLIHGPNGRPVGAVANKEEAPKVNQALSGYRSFMSKAGALKQLILNHGSEFTGEVAGEMDSLRTSLTLDIKNLEQGGALDSGLVSVVEGMIPNTTGWTGTLGNNAKALAKLQKAMQMVDEKTRNRVNSVGLKDAVVDLFAPPKAGQQAMAR